MPEHDAVHAAFTKVAKALAPLNEEEKKRVVRAVAILLDYPEATGDRPNQ